MRRKWKINRLTYQAKELAAKYNISAILAQVLLNREVKEEEINSFLRPSLSSLHSPFMLPDMKKSVERIRKAIKEKQKIFVVGDYDVDGISSLAIFYEFAKDFKDNFIFHIPHRVKDGYGLTKNIVNEAKKQGARLMICFDCGTNSCEEVELARSFNIDVIVVDHHQPKEDRNNPFAFINPKRKDFFYPFPDLSSAVLSFKLLQALRDFSCQSVLDLVALSLVCDVVPLKGENRILLSEGIKWIRRTERPSIKLLCEISRIKQENITPFHIGYILGPRINASGRVAHAKEALDIFLMEDEKKIYNVVSKLEEYNRLRKNIETEVLREAEIVLNRECVDRNAIIVEGENWHPGVLGIVASKLADKYYRPTFIISFDEDIGIGSARSIPSLSLIEILEQCAEYLLVYGGHKKAAGIKISKDRLEIFKNKINEKIEESLSPQDLIPFLEIDLALDFKDIDINLTGELEKLSPFGEENPPPLFVSFNIFKKSPLKKLNNAYSVWVSDGKRTFEAIVYDKNIMDIIEYADSMDIVYSLENNTYYNTPRLIIRDCRLAKGE
jgi:single-stranded-DNA-specific exonuclease